MAAAREDVPADVDTAADGDVDEPPCTCRHSQIAAVVVVGNGRTGAVGMRAVRIGGKVAPRRTYQAHIHVTEFCISATHEWVCR